MKVEINSDDLRGHYDSPMSCPLARSLKRQGYPLGFVTMTDVIMKGQSFPIKDPMKFKSIMLLARGSNGISIEWEVIGLENVEKGPITITNNEVFKEYLRRTRSLRRNNIYNTQLPEGWQG